MDWPNELVLKFLELYEEEAVIWNASHPNHKDRHHVHDAWKRIEKDLENKFSVPDLKKKKESLMASFRTCCKKINSIMKSGAATDEVYKPHWFAFEKMVSFLSEKDLPRQTMNTENNQLEVLQGVEEQIIADHNSESELEPNAGIVLPSSSTPLTCKAPSMRMNNTVRMVSQSVSSPIYSDLSAAVSTANSSPSYSSNTASCIASPDNDAFNLTSSTIENNLNEYVIIHQNNL